MELSRRDFLKAGGLAAAGAAAAAVAWEALGNNGGQEQRIEVAGEVIERDKKKAEKHAMAALAISGALNGLQTEAAKDLILQNTLESVRVNGFRGLPAEIKTPGIEGFDWFLVKGPNLKTGAPGAESIGRFSVYFGLNKDNGEVAWIKAAPSAEQNQEIIDGYNGLNAALQVVSEQKHVPVEQLAAWEPKLLTVTVGKNQFQAYAMPHFEQTLTWLSESHLTNQAELAVYLLDGLQASAEVFLRTGMWKKDQNPGNYAVMQLPDGRTATIPFDWESNSRMGLVPEFSDPRIGIQWMIQSADRVAKSRLKLPSWPYGLTPEELVPGLSTRARLSLPAPTTSGAILELQTAEGINALVPALDSEGKALEVAGDIIEGEYRVLPPSAAMIAGELAGEVLRTVPDGAMLMFLWTLAKEPDAKNMTELRFSEAKFNQQAIVEGLPKNQLDAFYNLAAQRKSAFIQSGRITDPEFAAYRSDWISLVKSGEVSGKKDEMVTFLNSSNKEMAATSLVGSINLKFGSHESDTYFTCIGDGIEENDANLIFWKKDKNGKPMKVAIASRKGDNAWDVLTYQSIEVSVTNAEGASGKNNPTYNIIGDQSDKSNLLILRADSS